MCLLFQEKLYHQYEQFQTIFGSHICGIVEIGSYARGEYISCSDHDLRVIINCQAPLFVFDEETWTERLEGGRFTLIQWGQLNQVEGMSFGLTNLAYIEKMILTGRFPLIDHTC